MSVAFVQKSTELFADAASSIAPSLASVTAGNHVVLLTAVSQNNSSSAAITISGGWTTAENPAITSALLYKAAVGIFYKENSAGGTESGTVSFAIGSYAAASIIESSGVNTSSSLSGHTNASGTATTSGNTGSAASTTGNAIVYVIGHAEDGSGATAAFSSPAATGFSAIDTEATNSVHIAYDFSYKIVTDTTALSGAWTWTTNSDYLNAIAIFDATTVPGLNAPTTKTVSISRLLLDVEDEGRFNELNVRNWW